MVECPTTTTSPLATRGEALFFSQEVGCSSCHLEGHGTDGVRPDVGSGGKFDTPSLRFLAGTAPYFHDGRYPTLKGLLQDTKTTMGSASQLTRPDFEALEAYLLTL